MRRDVVEKICIYSYSRETSEYDLQKQLNQALDQLTDLRQSHEDTQAELIGHGQKYGTHRGLDQVSGSFFLTKKV